MKADIYCEWCGMTRQTPPWDRKVYYQLRLKKSTRDSFLRYFYQEKARRPELTQDDFVQELLYARFKNF